MAYGLVVIPLIAVILWVILKAVKTEKNLLQAVSVFCLSYSGALVYGTLDLCFLWRLAGKRRSRLASRGFCGRSGR